MDYKHLTQEHIDSGGRNITSPEVYAEARIYNIEAVKNYKMSRRIRILFDTWIIVQYLLVFFITYFFVQDIHTEEINTGTSTPGWRIALGVVGLFGYYGLITYYMVIRECRNKVMLGVVSLPIMALTWGMAFFPIANYLAAWYYEKMDGRLARELGYPSFPRLSLTILNSDVERISDLTYDSIREKARRDHPHDETFL